MATWSTNVGKIALKWWHACRWAKRKGKLPVPDRQKTAGKPQARGSMSDRWVQGYAGEESHSSQAPEKGWSEVSFGLPSWERMAEWLPVATMMGWSRGCHGWDASSKECKHSQVLPNKAAVNDGAHVRVWLTVMALWHHSGVSWFSNDKNQYPSLITYPTVRQHITLTLRS